MISDSQGLRPGNSQRVLLAGALFLYIVLLIRLAWLCDDAYITFRTIDNFVHGHGLRWNVAERVQSYTHPLWMIVVACFTLPTREFFFTPIAVCVLTSTAVAFVIGWRVAATPVAGVLALTAMVMSRSFFDYSTSGLENPLTHLLLAIFFALWIRTEDSPRRLLLMSLTAGLAVVNRMDTALLYAPPVLALLVRSAVPFRKRLLLILAGALPLLLWEAFSLVYYGFLFPNTAYAKLNTGLSQTALVKQGMTYFLDVIARDPITPALIAGAVILSLRKGWRSFLPFSAGIVLYCLYLLKIGGDFMGGRFFTGPYLLAVAMFSRTPLGLRDIRSAGAGAVLLVLGLGATHPTVLLDPMDAPPVEDRWNRNGIADERFFYQLRAGLLTVSRDNFNVDAEYTHLDTLEQFAPIVYPEDIIGFAGFHAGPQVHFIDDIGLADPLIARLPPLYDEDWRIGHMVRMIPIGYHDTVQSGRDRFEDGDLAEYYRRLCVVTQGPIWSFERWVEILRFNTHGNRHLINTELYRRPDPQLAERAKYSEGLRYRIRLSQISEPEPDWVKADLTGHPSMRKLGHAIRIDCEGVRHEPFIEVNAGNNHAFRLDLYRSRTKLGEVEVESLERSSWLFCGIRLVEVPDDVAVKGYDRIEVVQIHGLDTGHLAHLRLLDERPEED